jgi:hypothetical protein
VWYSLSVTYYFLVLSYVLSNILHDDYFIYFIELIYYTLDVITSVSCRINILCITFQIRIYNNAAYLFFVCFFLFFFFLCKLMVWIFDYSYLQCLVANLVTVCLSKIITHKMKNRKCHTIRTVLKSYRNLVEPEAKLIPLTDKKQNKAKQNKNKNTKGVIRVRKSKKNR